MLIYILLCYTKPPLVFFYCLNPLLTSSNELFSIRKTLKIIAICFWMFYLAHRIPVEYDVVVTPPNYH